MAKYPPMFSSLESTLENDIFVANDFALDITSHGDVTYWHGHIIDVFYVPSLSASLLSVSQLTKTRKIVKFQPDRFFIKNLKDRLIIADGILDPKDRLYKFRDLPQPKSRMMTLIS